MNREDFYRKEQEADYAVLLNECWDSFAKRTGRPHGAAEPEHVKRCDETWEDYCNRKPLQEKYIRSGLLTVAAVEKAAEQEKTSRAKRSADTIDKLMAVEEELSRTKIPSRHWLYVDFGEYQQNVFAAQREFLTAEEQLIRVHIVEAIEGFYTAMNNTKIGDKKVMEARAEFARQKELERQREEELERQRQLQAQKEREKQLKMEEELAERQHKEQVEMEKRAERKRREEEKRAKARAEREKAKHAQSEEPATEVADV